MKKMLLSMIMMLAMAMPAMAAEVKLAWDANSESDLAGYRVYRGTTAGGPYIQAGDDVRAPLTTFTDAGLADGVFYWVVTAFDEIGNESGYSNEVSQRIDTTPPQPPQNLLKEAVELAIRSLQKYQEYLGALHIE